MKILLLSFEYLALSLYCLLWESILNRLLLLALDSSSPLSGKTLIYLSGKIYKIKVILRKKESVLNALTGKK